MSDSFGGFDPSAFSQVPLFRELAKVLSWRGGPVNWDLARQTAGSLVGPATALRHGSRDDAEVAAAVQAAELWLDEVTVLPAVEGPARALDGEEWVRLATTSQGLGPYVEPVARGMATALGKNLPQELSGMLGPAGGQGDVMGQMLGPMGAMLYGIQAGTVAGQLAGQLLGPYDLGLPTIDPHIVGTVGDTARAFADEIGVDQVEFRYWLVLRETAGRRQFGGVSWLRGHLSELLEQFAAAADFDPNRLLEGLGGLGLDPSAMMDPEKLRQSLEGQAGFRPDPTPGQAAVLAQLQALVGLLDGWVEVTVRRAAGNKLPSLGRIEEAARRRRAAQGPGERTLEQLVGLDLKPVDARQGPAFCDAVLAARGQAGLDRIWGSPELLPSPAELRDPSRWLLRLAAAEGQSGAVGLEDLPDGPEGIPDIPDDLSELDDPGR